MLINEVCKECNLTKKAVDYYTKQGLISPKLEDNNYRNFDTKDIKILKEIAILRKLDIPIADIKDIVSAKTSGDSHMLLSQYKARKEIEIQQKKAKLECLNYLIESKYDIGKTEEMINYKLDQNMIIKEKLLQVFPGNYGMFLYIHFGRFLNEKVDTNEKALAYRNIIEFLDGIDWSDFPEDVEKYLTESISVMNEIDYEKMDQSMINAVNNFEDYIKENDTNIKEYLEYRTSEEYMVSPAYKIQKALLDFQNHNGYYDKFISNLIIISKSYREYQEKIKLVNEEFLKMKNF